MRLRALFIALMLGSSLHSQPVEEIRSAMIEHRGVVIRPLDDGVRLGAIPLGDVDGDGRAPS